MGVPVTIEIDEREFSDAIEDVIDERIDVEGMVDDVIAKRMPSEKTIEGWVREEARKPVASMEDVRAYVDNLFGDLDDRIKKLEDSHKPSVWQRCKKWWR